MTTEPTETLPWLSMFNGAPIWIKLLILFGPNTVLMLGLVWFVTIDLREDNEAMRAEVASLNQTWREFSEGEETQMVILNRILENQQTLRRLEELNLIACLNAATNDVQERDCVERRVRLP